MVFHVGYNKKHGVRGYGISRGIQQETGLGVMVFHMGYNKKQGVRGYGISRGIQQETGG